MRLIELTGNSGTKVAIAIETISAIQWEEAEKRIIIYHHGQRTILQMGLLEGRKIYDYFLSELKAL